MGASVIGPGHQEVSLPKPNASQPPPDQGAGPHGLSAPGAIVSVYLSSVSLSHNACILGCTQFSSTNLYHSVTVLGTRGIQVNKGGHSSGSSQSRGRDRPAQITKGTELVGAECLWGPRGQRVVCREDTAQRKWHLK